MDIRQSPSYARFMSLEGWTADKSEVTYSYIKKLPLLGHFIKIQRPATITPKLIKTLEGKYHPFQILLEPSLNTDYSLLLTDHGFHKMKSPYLPSKTLTLDLTQSKEKLYSNLKKDCRYALRKTKDSLLTTPSSLPKIYEFRKAWKRSVPFTRYVPSRKNLENLKNSFKKTSLFLTTPDFTAGAIFLKAGPTAYYWQAFTDKEARKTLIQYQIVWQGILWAKKEGAKTFDFEGIYDNRFPNKSWLGFTYFKKGFGGIEIIYPQSLSKTYFKNLLYKK